MRLFRPLTHPPVAKLWAALGLAAIGDELFKVALIWLAVQELGERAAYITAVSSLTMLVAAALGGRFLDSRDPRGIMSATAMLRAVCALIPVMIALTVGSIVTGLVIAALSLAALRAQFDPAVQAALPQLARHPDEILAANGLADGAVRIARLLGPALAGPLAAMIPILHFFTLDAALLVGAWLLVMALPRLPPAPESGAAMRGLIASLQFVRSSIPLRTMFLASMISNAAWAISVTFALAILIQQRSLSWLGISGIGAYSLLIALYGLANISSNLLLASREKPPSFTLAYVGQGCGAMGFLMIGLLAGHGADSWMVPALALACMVISIGAPMHDLLLIVTIQAAGSGSAIAGVFRIRLMMQHIGILTGTLLAPMLLVRLGVSTTVLTMAIVQGLMAALVWLSLRRHGYR